MVTKRVEKPWGWELWLEQNDRYCYKRIFIKAGTRTSFQYHEHKLETNYIIAGEAEVWLENDDGEVEKIKMAAGDFFTVHPPKKHRVIALTDVTLQECSTPEVDDVIRIADDTNRGQGRIASEHINPAVCILAAGKGTRLEYLTKNVNKALLPVNDKAVISHIIDLVPKEFDIVIALGFGGDLIREYCTAYYPKRKFIFVDVDKTEGPGAGPGYSLSCCKEHLQRPFYWITADCIVDSFPSLTTNWLGVSRTGIPELYSTIDFDSENNITSILNKSVNGHNHAFIGFAGILDHDVFWHELEKNIKDTGEVVSAFYNPTAFPNFKALDMNWVDVGTIDGYIKARNNRYSLPKTTGECLYRQETNCSSCGSPGNSKCIKVFPQNIDNKKTRISYLSHLLPNVEILGEHTMSYDWVPGKTLYEINDFGVYTGFLEWANKNLWQPSNKNIGDLCSKFYKTKTYERFRRYLELKNHDESTIVNGKVCHRMQEYLDHMNWDRFGGKATAYFHGDLQFDNIILREGSKNDFVLIDWRDDFGGSPHLGDVYYDLAKLYGGMLINYREMKDGSKARVFHGHNGVQISQDETPTLDHVRKYFESWVQNHGYDMDTINNLTGIIFLNMAPLHEKPFSDFLFYKAKEIFHDLYQ